VLEKLPASTRKERLTDLEIMLRLSICSVCLTFDLIIAGCGSDSGSTTSASGEQASASGVENTGGATTSGAQSGRGASTSSGTVANTGGGASSNTGRMANAGGWSTIGGSSANGSSTSLRGTFAVPMMTIDVADGAAITSKEEYVSCTIAIDGEGSFADYSGQANIRGRGNSTWLWYDKKPYRLKLSEKSEILGLKADKDWVLLANYRDPTFLMNAFAFEMADWMGLEYTNHSRFLEVTLNGEYIGLYQLTEQVEQGTNRVAVADDGGILLELDEDDGPVAAPNAGDNFSSAKYALPVCVKYPENQSAAQLATIKDDFSRVEQAVAAADYDDLANVLDIASFIDFLIVQELTYNVELVTPRSMYMHKNPGGVYVMGPVWDFDGGFDFDWTDMTTSHDYFAAEDLVLGADPARAGTVSPFWVNMFKNGRFLSEFKARWVGIKDAIMSDCWGVMENDVASITAALDRNASRWPIAKDHSTETARMKQWLQARVTKLTSTINAYPAN
jgi:hypothetical protein